ncbi:MAG: hypothetical protein JSU72_19650 [Deltaproteobacteria bacterium]|nr:MAG: hypothetical protein JSU72_19650 [Deltaproteobacteria bacterium]
MRKLILCLAMFMITQPAASAAFLKGSVEYKDLARLSGEGLQALKETEFSVFLANVRLAAARNAGEDAREALKKAENERENERLNLKAAEAEHKAAEAAQDGDRLSKAKQSVERAKDAVKPAELLVKWRQKAFDASKAGVRKAKLALEVAETKRDMARIDRLVLEGVPTSKKYSRPDYEAKLKRVQQDHMKAIEREKREMSAAEQLRAQYEKAAALK